MNPMIKAARPNGKVSQPKKAPRPTELKFTLNETLADGTVKVVDPLEGTVEAHATKAGILRATFECAKAMRGWATNAECTEEEFAQAIKDVDDVRVR